jgi:hypothetical protein
MAKLSNLFGSKTIKITQTTHGHSATNTQDLRYQRAVDEVPVPFMDENSVYAQGDGVVEIAFNNGGLPDSYIQIKYNGIPFPKQIVHCYPVKGIAKGTKVKAGLRIGKMCKAVKDFYGKGIDHAPHIHDAFYDRTGKGLAPNPFDYLDRKTKVTATHKDILATNWFKNGVFQWSVFKDLGKSPTPVTPPVVPPVTPPTVPPVDWEAKYTDLYVKINEPLTGYIRQIEDITSMVELRNKEIVGLNKELDTYKKYDSLVKILESIFGRK